MSGQSRDAMFRSVGGSLMLGNIMLRCDCGTGPTCERSHDVWCPFRTLMAAARELLTALQRFAIVGGDGPITAGIYQMTGDDIRAARAAIAKATGQE